MTDGEPKAAVSASLQTIKLIKNQHKLLISFFYFSKSQTSDSFVNHFDGHFAYLKTLDFSFNKCKRVIVGVVLSEHGKKCDTAIFCPCHTQSH